MALTIFSFIGSAGSNMQEGGLKDVKTSDFSGFYAYDRSLALNVTEELVKDEGAYKLYKVYFDSVNGERVPGLLSTPKGKENVPCAVFLHGYGGSKEDIIEAAGPVAAEGYALMAIDAEYHGERREEGKALYSPDMNQSRNGMIQTIIDLRRAVDYLETRPEIDTEKIGYVGGSMGGILGAIFIGVEPRVKVAALLVAGGNMSLMIRESQHHTMPSIREHLETQGISYEELQEFLDPVDPINLIANFSPRPVVFHLGRYDRIVPTEAGEQLYRMAGEPKSVYWYDSGHDLPLELVLSRVLDFTDRELMGKRLVFHETKYWISRYMIPISVAVAGITSLAYLIMRKWRKRRRFSLRCLLAS